MRWVLVILIKGYQLVVGPFMGGTCRFYPSCSEYAMEAIRKHGALKGCWLMIKRLGKCHPWHKGGIDEVP